MTPMKLLQDQNHGTFVWTQKLQFLCTPQIPSQDKGAYFIPHPKIADDYEDEGDDRDDSDDVDDADDDSDAYDDDDGDGGSINSTWAMLVSVAVVWLRRSSAGSLAKAEG